MALKARDQWYRARAEKRRLAKAKKIEHEKHGPHFTGNPLGRFARNTAISIIHGLELDRDRPLCWAGRDGKDFSIYTRGDADFLTCKRCRIKSNNLGLHTD